MTRALLLKFGRNAGKSTITVRLPASPPPPRPLPPAHPLLPAPGLERRILEEGGSRPQAAFGGPGAPLRSGFPPQVIAEDISGNNGYVELSFRARKLDDKVRAGCPG